MGSGETAAGFVPDVPISVDAAIPEDHNKTLRQRLHDKTKHAILLEVP